MKDLIKIIIAIAFILGAYILGNYQDNEKHKLQIVELNKIIYSDKDTIAHLRDSVSKLKLTIDTINTKTQSIKHKHPWRVETELSGDPNCRFSNVGKLTNCRTLNQRISFLLPFSLDDKTIRKYQHFQTNIALANRHIALLFDTYQQIITETAAKGEKPPAEICVPLMKSLAVECLSLYNNIPVIVCIYMGEALQSAGMTEKQEHILKCLYSFIQIQFLC